MGYHYDMQYNMNRKFKNWSTSQCEDTPTGIVTLLDNRSLKWRRLKRDVNKDGKMDWIVDTSWAQLIDMNTEIILILNPKDEKPHIYSNGNMTVKYQHGNVSVTKNKMSFALVFRVVNEFCNYDRQTNAMIPTKDVCSDKYIEKYPI